MLATCVKTLYRAWRRGRCDPFYRNLGLGKRDNRLGDVQYGTWGREVRDVET